MFTINRHTINDNKIAEILSNEIIIRTADEGLELLVDIYYQDFDKIILYEKNITPDFFDLKNGMAGEILQKFFNYRIRLAMIGDFSKHSGQAIKDFIIESNKLKQINFLTTLTEALNILSKN